MADDINDGFILVAVAHWGNGAGRERVSALHGCVAGLSSSNNNARLYPLVDDDVARNNRVAHDVGSHGNDLDGAEGDASRGDASECSCGRS